MNDSTDVSNMSSSISNSSDNEIENEYEEQAHIQKARNKRHIAFKNNSQLIQHMSDGYRCMNETTNNYSNQTNNTSVMSTVSNRQDKQGNLNLLATHLQTSSFILYHKSENNHPSHKTDAFRSPLDNQRINLNSFVRQISKTPKTIKRKGQLIAAGEKSKQVFGTPDYLSPELLLGIYFYI